MKPPLGLHLRVCGKGNRTAEGHALEEDLELCGLGKDFSDAADKNWMQPSQERITMALGKGSVLLKASERQNSRREPSSVPFLMDYVLGQHLCFV